MTDYSKSKIYKIIVNNTEDEYKPYIGSTVKKYLSERMSNHRAHYKLFKNGEKRSSLSSYNLFDKYGIENCEIVLIENYPCATKDELHSRERYWFDTVENCNKNKPIKTDYEIEYKQKLLYQRQLELHPDSYNCKKEILKNKYTCECGSHIRATDKPRHNKSKKHLNYIATIPTQQEV
jgi:enoyl reductase-like protein